MRQVGVWFHRTFDRDRHFTPEPFAPPPDPHVETDMLRDELERLRSEFEAKASEAARAREAGERELKQRRRAEDLAEAASEESKVWQELAEQAEVRLLKLQGEGAELRQQHAQQSSAARQETAQRAAAAAGQIGLSELETRKIIDQQLRDRGWEADAETIR